MRSRGLHPTVGEHRYSRGVAADEIARSCRWIVAPEARDDLLPRHHADRIRQTRGEARSRRDCRRTDASIAARPAKARMQVPCKIAVATHCAGGRFGRVGIAVIGCIGKPMRLVGVDVIGKFYCRGSVGNPRGQTVRGRQQATSAAFVPSARN